MPMRSVCPGCAHEQACGHAEVHECANRVPASWCSCDPLRKAEAERDRYRAKALQQTCYTRAVVTRCCDACRFGGNTYCSDVIEEVDGE